MFDNLKELCLLNGTSGNEDAVREYIIKVINVKTETIPWIEDMYLSRSFSNLIIAVSNDPYCKFKVAKIATIFIHD